MADYAVVDKEYLDNGLSKIANSIKTKSRNTEEMAFPDGFEERVNSIPESFWTEDDVFNLLSDKDAVQFLKIPENITAISDYAFYSMSNLSLSELPDNVEKIGNSAFMECSRIAFEKLPINLKIIGTSAFRRTAIAISELPSMLESIGTYAFMNGEAITISVIPAAVKTIGTRCFDGCTGITELTFKGTPTTIDSGALNCSNLTVINVPWAEGEVANAPWGASNATINYNYVESEE